jgi:hypothetical protein
VTRESALLYDLAGLIKKHGPAAFSDLVKFLRDPDALGELVAILEAAETASRRAHVPELRTVKKTHGRARNDGTQNLLSGLASRDPEKGEILSSLYESLLAKRALPTLADLRRFARDNGLREITVTSREKAISLLLRDLSGRTTDDVRSMFRRVQAMGTSGDRSLEGWTDVILRKDRPRGGL